MGGLQAQSMNYYNTVQSGRAVQVARSAVEDAGPAARCSNGGIGVLSGCTISGSGGSCTGSGCGGGLLVYSVVVAPGRKGRNGGCGRFESGS